ncbi:MAG: tripartite tricarboxylate transporter substrate binding protein [Betaproteobacteria bacterium]|nr:tripartite tricarboxylate transporter substrate binding protein [Betaproteobacteria bacterium]
MNWWRVGVVVLGLFAQGTALAQFPTRSVKIVVPYAAGGTADLSTRIVAQKLTELTGQSWIIENKGGASGQLGYQTVAAAAPDGYTLVSADSAYTMLPLQYSKLGWNWEADLIPVTMYSSTSYIIIASQASGIKSLQDLIAVAKANPGKLNYGSGGVGNANHVVTEDFAKKAGIKMTHVPFRGRCRCDERATGRFDRCALYRRRGNLRVRSSQASSSRSP